MKHFYLIPNDLFKVIFQFLNILDIMNFEEAIINCNFGNDLLNNLIIVNNLTLPINKLQLLWMKNNLIRIESIRFDRYITDKDIIYSLKVFSNIIHINFNNCKYITDITIESLYKTLNDQNQIQSLNLSHCQNITKQSIELITNHSKNLQIINLNYCYFNSELLQREYYFINLIENSNNNLLKLDLEGLNVSNNVVITVCNYCNNLYYLNINYSYMITDKIIELLSIQCSSLQVLLVSSCHRLSDISMISLSNHCKHLEYLDISDCRKITMEGILQVRNNCN